MDKFSRIQEEWLETPAEEELEFYEEELDFYADQELEERQLDRED